MKVKDKINLNLKLKQRGREELNQTPSGGLQDCK